MNPSDQNGGRPLWATRIVACQRSHLEIFIFRHTEGLVHLRDRFDQFVVMSAVGAFTHLANEDMGDCVTVMIQSDRAGRGVERQITEGIFEGCLIIGKIAVDLFQRQQRCQGIHIVAIGQE